MISIVLAGCQDGRSRPPLPNVVLISLDTLRADHLDLYGYARRTAPNLRRFGEDAVVFERAYSQSPKTAPSHMTLLTGLYPAAHAVRNLGDGPPRALPPDVVTMAQILASAGYQTAAHTASGHVTATLGFDRGFDSFAEGGSVAAVFESVAGSVETLSGSARPFFIFAHTYEIHDPYAPPSRFQIFNDDTYDGPVVGDRERLQQLAGRDWSRQHQIYWNSVRRGEARDRQRLEDLYDASILYTDVHLGRLLDRLRQLEEFDRSIIIVVSDHGEEFGDHGGFLHETVYEEILRVPLLIRFPPSAAPGSNGRRVNEIVRLIDVLPTLLDFLGVRPAAPLQGESFLSLLEGGPAPRRRPVWSHWPRGSTREPQALLLDGWKLIENGRGAAVQLYDMTSDPRELVDLAANHPDVIDRLRAVRDRLRATSEKLHARMRTGEAVEISPALEQQLRALGYLR